MDVKGAKALSERLAEAASNVDARLSNLPTRAQLETAATAGKASSAGRATEGGASRSCRNQQSPASGQGSCSSRRQREFERGS